jgi:hypothetical protein
MIVGLSEISVVWYVTPFSVVELEVLIIKQGDNVKARLAPSMLLEFKFVSCLPYSSTLKMEATCSFWNVCWVHILEQLCSTGVMCASGARRKHLTLIKLKHWNLVNLELPLLLSHLTNRSEPHSLTNKQTPWSVSASELHRPSDHRLSAKWLPTFVDRGCHVISVTDPYGRILDFLDRSRYFSIK